MNRVFELSNMDTETSMAQHEHGKMDISAQKKAFAGFMRMTTWGAVISIGILIFMALVNA
jgi:hypothetical protein